MNKYGKILKSLTNLTFLQDPIEPTSFWLNPFGVAWNTIEASDLILVDKNAKVVAGGPVRLMNTAGMQRQP